jgi:hypothetical protein
MIHTVSKPRNVLVKALAGAALFTAFTAAQAGVLTIPNSNLKPSPGKYTAGGYYTNDLGPNIITTGGGNAANVGQADGRNDDGYMALNLGFNVTFFGHTYNSLFINNNGNVSFGSGISSYLPAGVTGANAPIISPFFGDVDTRGTGSGVVHYNLSADQLVVTWDNVGFYDEHGTPTDSFQLVLRKDGYTPAAGEGLIGFFYQSMGWEVTDTSTKAAVGFGDGEGNAQTIEGSLLPNVKDIVQNKYIWFGANLETVPPVNGVPEPSALALTMIGLLGAGLSARRKRKA